MNNQPVIRPMERRPRAVVDLIMVKSGGGGGGDVDENDNDDKDADDDDDDNDDDDEAKARCAKENSITYFGSTCAGSLTK